MNIRLSVALLTLSLLLVGGCRGGPASEVISGGVGTRSLSERQVKLLNTWFEQHRSGWYKILYTPTHGDLHVTVRSRTGESGYVEFFPTDKGMLIFWASDPAKTRMAHFDASEVGALRQELEAPQ